MPYVSVVVPAYNSEKTIERCLRGVRDSAYQDYELIVADSGSQDQTLSIAARYADRVITLEGKGGRKETRRSGLRAAKGRIIVNVDSDVVIKPDTLARIAAYFSHHEEVDALTGLLSKEHPHSDFFSQYKNLYMNYTFNKLPEKVTFLYGSIYALRRSVADLCDSDPAGIKTADDTALGQKLVAEGKRISFLKDLEVIHLKRYDLLSFIKNDFQIPRDWAKIFLQYAGWGQLGKNQTGFAHSPKEQLVSILLAPVILFLCLGVLLGYPLIPGILLLTPAWFFLNLRFLRFLAEEKGILFALLSSLVTFLDHLVMAAGILCGWVALSRIALATSNAMSRQSSGPRIR